jgi:hypothetical protein
VSGRRATRLGWSLWALSLVVVALMFGCYLLGLGISLENRDRPPLAFIPVMALFVLAFSTVGALVASRQPGNPVGWLFCAASLLAGISFAGQFYADYALVAEPGAAPGGRLALWLSVWLIAPALSALTLFAVLFPNGRLLTPRWRLVAWAALASGVALAGSLAFQPGTLDDRNFPGVRNPAGIPGAGGAIEVVETVAVGLALGALLAAVASLVVRFRRAVGVERQQLKWIAFSGALAAAGLVAVLPITASPWDDVVFVIAFLSTLGVPISAGLAILRYRLYDIDLVVNRTLVYGTLTALLAGTYLGFVLLLQLALGPVTEGNELAVAVSTLAVAALFRPARRRIQGVVDRRFYRRKYDATQMLEAFSTRLRDEVELETLAADLRGVVVETVQPAHVSLWLREVAR